LLPVNAVSILIYKVAADGFQLAKVSEEADTVFSVNMIAICALRE
jgi:hypothetical protein